MKRTPFLIITLLLVFAMTASAQVPQKPFNIYLGGGLTMPSSPDYFKDTHKKGFHAMGGLGFNAYPFIQLVGHVEYFSVAMDWDELRTLEGLGTAAIEGGRRNFWLFGADARFAIGPPASPIKPFVFAGAGLARISQTDIETGLPAVDLLAFTAETENKLYWNVGGGVEFNVVPMITLFLQGRMVSIKQDDENFVMIPITLGIKL